MSQEVRIGYNIDVNAPGARGATDDLRALQEQESKTAEQFLKSATAADKAASAIDNLEKVLKTVSGGQSVDLGVTKAFNDVRTSMSEVLGLASKIDSERLSIAVDTSDIKRASVEMRTFLALKREIDQAYLRSEVAAAPRGAERINVVRNQRTSDITRLSGVVPEQDLADLERQTHETADRDILTQNLRPVEQRLTATERTNQRDETKLDEHPDQTRTANNEALRQRLLLLAQSEDSQRRVNALVDQLNAAEANQSAIKYRVDAKNQEIKAQEQLDTLVQKSQTAELSRLERIEAERQKSLSELGGVLPGSTDVINQSFDQQASVERQRQITQSLAPVDRGANTLEAANAKQQEAQAFLEGKEKAVLELRERSLEVKRQEQLAIARTAEEESLVNGIINRRIQVERDTASAREGVRLRQEQLQAEEAVAHLVEKTNQSELSGIQKIRAEQQKYLEQFGKTPELREKINQSFDTQASQEEQASGRHGNVRRLVLGAKDLAEGYSRGAVIEGVDYLMSLRGGTGAGPGSGGPGGAAGGGILGGLSDLSGLAKFGLAAGGAAIGLGLLATKLTELVERESAAAKEMEDFAQRTGLTIQEAQQFSGAAHIAGVNASALEASMRQLAPALTDNSQEGKKAREALAQLGVATADFNFTARPMGQVLQDIATKLAALPTFAQRQTLALDILGRGGKALVPELLELSSAMERVGKTDLLSDKQTEDLAKASEAIKLIGLSWEHLKAQLASKAVGIVQVIAPDFTDPGRSEFESLLHQHYQPRPQAASTPQDRSDIFDNAALGYQPEIPSAKETAATTLRYANTQLEDISKQQQPFLDLQKQRADIAKDLASGGITDAQRQTLSAGIPALDSQIKAKQGEYDDLKRKATAIQGIVKDLQTTLTPHADQAQSAIEAFGKLEGSRALPILDAALKRAESTKEGLQAAVKQAEEALSRVNIDITAAHQTVVSTGQGNSQRAAQLATEQSRAQSDLLTAQNRLKAFEAAPRTENRFEQERDRIAAEDYKATHPAAEFGRIPELQNQLQDTIAGYRRDPNFTAAQRNQLISDRERQSNRDIILEARNVAGNQEYKRFGTQQIDTNAGIQGLQEQFSNAQRLTALHAGGKDETEADVEQAYQKQLDLARQIRDIHLSDLQVEKAKLAAIGDHSHDTDIAKDEANAHKQFVDEQVKAESDRLIRTETIRAKDRDEAQKTQEELAKLQTKTEAKTFADKIDHAQKLAALNRQSGESPITGVQQAYETQLKLAQLEHDTVVAENAITYAGTDKDSVGKQKIADEEAYKTLTEERQKAEYEAEEKLAELRKQERDEAKQQAASLYDALRGGEKSTRDFFKAQLNDIGRNIFSAGAAPILQGLSTAINPSGGGIAGIGLQNTLLGSSTGASQAQPGAPTQRPSGFLGQLEHLFGIGPQHQQPQANTPHPAPITAGTPAIDSHAEPLISSLDNNRYAIRDLTTAITNITPGGGVGPNPLAQNPLGSAAVPESHEVLPGVTELGASSLVQSSKNAVDAVNTLATNQPTVPGPIDFSSLGEFLPEPVKAPISIFGHEEEVGEKSPIQSPLFAPNIHVQPSALSVLSPVTGPSYSTTNAYHDGGSLQSPLSVQSVESAQRTHQQQFTAPSGVPNADYDFSDGHRPFLSRQGVQPNTDIVAPPHTPPAGTPNPWELSVPSPYVTPPPSPAAPPAPTAENLSPSGFPILGGKELAASSLSDGILAGAKQIGQGFLDTGPTSLLQAAKRYAIDIPLEEGNKAVASFQKGDYLGAAGHTIASLPVVPGLVSDTVASSQQLLQRGQNDVNQGDYLAGASHDLAALVPVIGPTAVAISDNLADSKTALKGIGQIAGLAATGGVSALDIPKLNLPADHPIFEALKDETGSVGSGSGRHVAPAQAALDEINQRFPSNPANPLGRLITNEQGAPIAALEATVREDRLRLKTLQTFEQGKGNGSKALDSVLGIADKHQAVVEGTASSYGNGRLSTDELKQWYATRGFTPEPGFDDAYGYIIRQPKPVIPDIDLPSGRSKLAQSTYKPSTQLKQQLADQSEAELSKTLGIPRTQGNAPFDLQNENLGIEIKTLLNNSNDKITMHPESLNRKLAAVDNTGVTPYTVVADKRSDTPSYYYKQGLGSFRLSSLTPTDSLADLKRVIDTASAQHRASTPPSAFQIYSPNEADNLSFNQAIGGLTSPAHQRLFDTSKQIDEALGIKSQQANAIGDWSDGAENSIFNTIEKAPSFDAVRYSAALKGDLANQKAVIPFEVKPKGPDSLYRVTVPNATPEQLRASLDAEGLQYRTLIPKGKVGTEVSIFDSGSQLRDNIKRFATDNNVQYRSYRGQGEFLGGDTREAGHDAYHQVISDYEAKSGDRLHERFVGQELPDAATRPITNTPLPQAVIPPEFSATQRFINQAIPEPATGPISSLSKSPYGFDVLGDKDLASTALTPGILSDTGTSAPSQPQSSENPWVLPVLPPYQSAPIAQSSTPDQASTGSAFENYAISQFPHVPTVPAQLAALPAQLATPSFATQHPALTRSGTTAAQLVALSAPAAIRTRDNLGDLQYNKYAIGTAAYGDASVLLNALDRRSPATAASGGIGNDILNTVESIFGVKRPTAKPAAQQSVRQANPPSTQAPATPGQLIPTTIPHFDAFDAKNLKAAGISAADFASAQQYQGFAPTESNVEPNGEWRSRLDNRPVGTSYVIQRQALSSGPSALRSPYGSSSNQQHSGTTTVVLDTSGRLLTMYDSDTVPQSKESVSSNISYGGDASRESVSSNISYAGGSTGTAGIAGSPVTNAFDQIDFGSFGSSGANASHPVTSASSTTENPWVLPVLPPYASPLNTPSAEGSSSPELHASFNSQGAQVLSQSVRNAANPLGSTSGIIHSAQAVFSGLTNAYSDFKALQKAIHPPQPATKPVTPQPSTIGPYPTPANLPSQPQFSGPAPFSQSINSEGINGPLPTYIGQTISGSYQNSGDSLTRLDSGLILRQSGDQTAPAAASSSLTPDVSSSISYSPASDALPANYESLPGTPALAPSPASGLSPWELPTPPPFTQANSSAQPGGGFDVVGPNANAAAIHAATLTNGLSSQTAPFNSGGAGILPKSLLDAANPFNSVGSTINTVMSLGQSLAGGVSAAGSLANAVGGSGGGSSDSGSISDDSSPGGYATQETINYGDGSSQTVGGTGTFADGSVGSDYDANGNFDFGSLGGSSSVSGGIGGNGGGITLPDSSADATSGISSLLSGLGSQGAGLAKAVSGFSAGGAKGSTGGVASVLGVAAGIDPEPISKAILGISAAVAGIVSALLGDPRAERAKHLTQESETDKLAALAYTQPGINLEESAAGGKSVDTDFQGNSRVLNEKPYVYDINEAIGFDPIHPDRVVTEAVRQIGNQPLPGVPSSPVAPLASTDLTTPVRAQTDTTAYPGTAGSAAQQAQQAQANSPLSSNVTFHNTFNNHSLDGADLMRRAPELATAISSQLLTSHRIVNDIRSISNVT